MAKAGSNSAKNGLMQIRLDSSEKKTFNDAARHAGISLSSWARERLRRAAIMELEAANLPIEFLKDVRLD